jgi:hypothetical protein
MAPLFRVSTLDVLAEEKIVAPLLIIQRIGLGGSHDVRLTSVMKLILIT